MRIIAGEFRGRKILPPEGDTTRPITDRVKQSLFDILTPRIEGARVYDLFAGTGSMGLECLSRGAEHVKFFEADRGAVGGLRKNIDALGVGGRCEIVAGDLFKWFAAAAKSGARVDLVFLDPPYRFLKEQAEKLGDLARSIEQKHLSDDGLVVFRHDAEDELALPLLKIIDRRVYGSMALEFLSRAAAV